MLKKTRKAIAAGAFTVTIAGAVAAQHEPCDQPHLHYDGAPFQHAGDDGGRLISRGTYMASGQQAAEGRGAVVVYDKRERY